MLAILLLKQVISKTGTPSVESSLDNYRGLLEYMEGQLILKAETTGMEERPTERLTLDAVL